MDSTVENTSPIDVSTLIGKRYTIEQMRPVLAAHLDLSSNLVSAPVGLEIKKLLDGKQTNIIPLKDGDAAKLSVINHPTRGLSINVMHVQARLQLRDNYLGHQFSPTDKENLQRYGDMGRAVQLIDPSSGTPFRGIIGINPETQKMTVINTDKFPIPDKLLGVPIDPSAKERLREGYSIRINNMKKDDQTFSAFVRLAASRSGFKFERIKPPKLEQTPKTSQLVTSQAAERSTSATPLLDSLSYAGKGIRQTTQAYPNGVEVLVIPQAEKAKYVLSIKLPQLAQAPETGKLFALPIMATKTEAEALLQLSQQLDKAIGKNQPLLPVLQQTPESVQRLLHLDLMKTLNKKNDLPPSGTDLQTAARPIPHSAQQQLKTASVTKQGEQTTKPAQVKPDVEAKTAKAKVSKPKTDVKPPKGPRP
ncbi:hypothetical protein GCM10028816_46420 [Spirosoma lituiforme]